MEELISVTKPFSFDVEEALKTGFYVSGTTGCGKSDVAMYCVDALRKAGAIIYIFDPSQDWLERYPAITFGVRFNGRNPTHDLNKMQLRDTIFDTSTLTVLQLQEFADKFSWLLFQHQASLPKESRNQFFVLFEEAQMVLPQNSLSAKRLQNVVRLLTIGRNYKIRMGVVTQFASMVDKNAMRFMTQKWFGWTDEYNDVKRIATMVGDEAAEELKFYEPGNFLYYYPRQQIQEKITITPHR